MTRPEQLSGLTVMLHRDMPDTFTAWRRAAGLDGIEPAAIDHFDSGALMLEAAAQGLGVAFMHESHFDDASDPRLVRLFETATASPYRNWIITLPKRHDDPKVRRFREWLIREVEADGLPRSVDPG